MGPAPPCCQAAPADTESCRQRHILFHLGQQLEYGPSHKLPGQRCKSPFASLLAEQEWHLPTVFTQVRCRHTGLYITGGSTSRAYPLLISWDELPQASAYESYACRTNVNQHNEQRHYCAKLTMETHIQVFSAESQAELMLSELAVADNQDTT